MLIVEQHVFEVMKTNPSGTISDQLNFLVYVTPIPRNTRTQTLEGPLIFRRFMTVK